ncbi:MAG: DUF169 domain-containing protein [Actinobacteria bacterium]|nr:DUF169 domain-containing protein [Actinomycetota bacterium]
MIRSVPTADLKRAADELGRRTGFLLAPTAFYFAQEAPAGAVTPKAGAWTCLFALMRRVQAGRPSSFSAREPGCIGASCYLGFNGVPVGPAAFYLSKIEHLKKDLGLAAAFYKGIEPVPARKDHLVFTLLDNVPGDEEVEVVNLWLEAASLSSLHTLANYDRSANDNVIMPFASGCQSLWTLPYKEKSSRQPKAVAGSMDPTVRPYLPPGAISFSVPAGRLLEMAGNVAGSFLGP